MSSVFISLPREADAYRLLLARTVQDPRLWIELHLKDDEASVAQKLLLLFEQRRVLVVHEIQSGIITAGVPTHKRLQLIAGPGIRQRPELIRFYFRLDTPSFEDVSLEETKTTIDLIVSALLEVQHPPTRAVLLTTTHVLAEP